MSNILVIGDSIIDHYVYGSVNRQSPEDFTIPVVDIESEEYRLGGCLNVASNLASLAQYDKIHVSSFISSFTKNLLQSKGIDSSMSFCVPSRVHKPADYELLKLRVINSESKKQLIRLDNRKGIEDDVIAFYKSCVREFDFGYFDAIVVSDYNKGLINQEVIAKLASFRGPIFIDTKKEDLTIWNKLHQPIVKINDKEFSSCTGKESIRNLIVTMGSEGCSCYRAGVETLHCDEDEFIFDPDVIGAGDVFLAAFTLKYTESKCLKLSMEYANKVAGISVTKKGTCEVTYEEANER